MGECSGVGVICLLSWQEVAHQHMYGQEWGRDVKMRCLPSYLVATELADCSTLLSIRCIPFKSDDLEIVSVHLAPNIPPNMHCSVDT